MDGHRSVRCLKARYSDEPVGTEPKGASRQNEVTGTDVVTYSRESEGTVKTMSTVKLIGVALLASVTASIVSSGAQSSPDAKTPGPPAGPSISIDDVDRFYHVYDAADGHPNADKLQHDYLDEVSEGLRQFAKLRRISGTTIAANLAKHPEMYSNARSCADVLPHVRQRVAVALHKLGDLYPEAKSSALISPISPS